MPERREHKAKTSSRGGTFGGRVGNERRIDNDLSDFFEVLTDGEEINLANMQYIEQRSSTDRRINDKRKL